MNSAVEVDIDAALAEALVFWTGWKRTHSPSRDKTEFVSKFGPRVADELLPRVRRLEEVFYSSDARYKAASLTELAERSAADSREKLPETPREVTMALAWCYAFDFK